MIFIRAVQTKAIEIEIEYIDYIIARSISDLFREWIDSIKEQQADSRVKFIQKKSHYATRIVSMSFIAVSLVCAVYYAKAFLSGHSVSSVLITQFLLIAGTGILLSKEIGLFLGRNIERKIDSISTNDVSFILINSGDKRQYKKFQDDMVSEKSEAWKSAFIALAIGVCSSVLATIIYNTYLM